MINARKKKMIADSATVDAASTKKKFGIAGFVHLATYCQTGGIENINKTMLRALSEIAVTEDATVESISVYDLKNTVTYPRVRYFNFNRNKWRATLFFLQSFWKYDALVVSHVNLAPIVTIAKLLRPRLPTYVVVYGIDVWKTLPSYTRWLLKRSTVLSLSNFTSETLMKKNNIERMPTCIHHASMIQI